MFNPQQFADEMQKYALGQDAYSAAIGSRRATLYVFSPNILPQQVLRPYRYNFSPNLTDAIINNSTGSNEGLQTVLNRDIRGTISEDLNKAVLPDANGIMIDTNTASSQWSFVLIIDNTLGPYGPRMQTISPINRAIISGYCTDEPVDRRTNAINMSAMLVPTTTDFTAMSPTIGPRGEEIKPKHIVNSDIIDNRMSSVVDSALYMGTPYDLMNSLRYNSFDNSTSITPSTSSVMGSSSVVKLNNSIKSPIENISGILSGLNSSIVRADAVSEGTESVCTPSRVESPDDIAFNEFSYVAPGRVVSTPNVGIDTSLPITMASLIEQYHNLDVTVVPVPTVNIWDCSPQNVQTKRNMMSSLLASALPTIMVSSGLASIAFRYDSYVIQTQAVTGGNDGVFHPLGWSTIVESTPHKQEVAINLFKFELINNIVPIVRTIGGEFSLMCTIDIVGHILIDLLYHDDWSQNIGEGWYETNGKLGGYMNPMLCDAQTFETNATNLTSLAKNITTSYWDTTPTFKQVINTNINDYQYTGNVGQPTPGGYCNFKQPPQQQQQPVAQTPFEFKTTHEEPTVRSGLTDIL